MLRTGKVCKVNYTRNTGVNAERMIPGTQNVNNPISILREAIQNAALVHAHTG